MSFHVTNRMGEMFSSPDSATIDRVLAELDEPIDDEHPNVALTHESGWSLGAFPYGGVTWENVEDRDAPEPRHLDAMTRNEVRRLWLTLALGNISEIELQPWLPGYG